MHGTYMQYVHVFETQTDLKFLPCALDLRMYNVTSNVHMCILYVVYNVSRPLLNI